jgi:hypothetical protein
VARYLDLESPEDRGVLLDMVAALIARIAANPQLTIEFGTVASYSRQDNQALSDTQVSMAGDPADHVIPAINLLPNAPRRGQRVAVAFAPPQQAYVIGSMPDTIVCRAATFRISTDEAWGSLERHPLVAPVETSELNPVCGFELVDSDDDDELDSIVIPESGTYVVSAGVSVNGPEGVFLANGVEIALDIIVGTETVAFASDRMDSGSHASASLNTAARVFYAERGQTVYVSGGSSSVDTSEVIFPESSFVSIWQLCCDYEPAVAVEEGDPE